MHATANKRGKQCDARHAPQHVVDAVVDGAHVAQIDEARMVLHEEVLRALALRPEERIEHGEEEAARGAACTTPPSASRHAKA